MSKELLEASGNQCNSDKAGSMKDAAYQEVSGLDR